MGLNQLNTQNPVLKLTKPQKHSVPPSVLTVCLESPIPNLQNFPQVPYKHGHLPIALTPNKCASIPVCARDAR